mmetsp:Transcript_10417/g.31846  ORF Transcript_10417/g.31846 Transcript_10417/m.31846 type:complete len:110 (+) Transcript_10417:1276-1605(+)
MLAAAGQQHNWPHGSARMTHKKPRTFRAVGSRRVRRSRCCGEELLSSMRVKFLTDGRLNALSSAAKSTVYTDIAQRGALQGFSRHSQPAREPLPPFGAETALTKVVCTP